MPAGVGAGYTVAHTGSTWGIDLEGAKLLQRALKVLAQPDAPFLRHALEQSGDLLSAAARRRAPASIANKTRFSGVKGTRGNTLRAMIVSDHKGARSYEFGRFQYYRGFRGRAVKATGQRFTVPAGRGQKPRPFIGIVDGDAAIAEVKDEVAELLSAAIELEWERIAVNGGEE